MDENLRIANSYEVYTTELRVSVRVYFIVVNTIAIRSVHSTNTLKKV